MILKLDDEELQRIASPDDIAGRMAAELLETRRDARVLAMIIARQDMNRAGMATLGRWIADALQNGHEMESETRQ